MNYNITTVWLVLSAIIHRYYDTKKKRETIYYEEGDKEYSLGVDQKNIIRIVISAIILFMCFFLDEYFSLNEFILSVEILVFFFVIALVVIIRRFRYFDYKVNLTKKRLTVINRDKIVFDHQVSDILYLSENKKLNIVFGFKVYTRDEDSVYISRDFNNFELLKMKINEYKDKAKNNE